MKSKIGQTTNAAFGLVLFVMGFIVLYIVLLPSSDRDWLLYGNQTNTNIENYSTSTQHNVIFSQKNIQLGPALNDDTFDIALEPFELYTKIQNSEYMEINPVHITRSIIFNNKKTVTFNIDDFTNLKDMQLRFKAENALGNLNIYVNGYLVSEMDQSEFETHKDLQNPINIPKSVLKQQGNEIIFELSSPGIYFWRVNSYELSNVNLYEDVQIYNQQATLTFDFSKDELANINDISLVYSVIVTNPNNVDISLNNRLIFSGEPTAEGESTYKILPSDVQEHNTLTFISQKGSYNFFDMSIRGDYKQTENQNYYFTADTTQQHTYTINFDLIDDINEKNFIFYINDHAYNVDTTSNSYSVDITSSIVSGTNALLFAPSSDVAISNLNIVEDFHHFTN